VRVIEDNISRTSCYKYAIDWFVVYAATLFHLCITHIYIYIYIEREREREREREGESIERVENYVINVGQMWIL
jgi:hypothetical protein